MDEQTAKVVKAYEAGFENGRVRVKLRGWAAGALVGLVITAAVVAIVKNK
jgi:hypothetical protein